MVNSGVVCSAMSREVGEQLFGTCVRVDVWFLLEYNRVWGAKAFDESDLSESVKSWLDGQLKAIPNSRLHFIKQTATHEHLTFYLGVTSDQHPRLHKFTLKDYGDLRQLDIPAIVSGKSTAPLDETLFLVCTNGKRDRCCAKYGLPLYNALSQLAGEAVWQTTHIAGHRFAATMLCFPHGLCYGRLSADDAESVVESYDSGHVLLDKFRGRSCYSPLAQAAEYYLRQHSANTDLSSLRLRGEGDAFADFEMEGRPYRIQLDARLSEWASYQSCNAAAPEQVTQYFLNTVDRM